MSVQRAGPLHAAGLCRYRAAHATDKPHEERGEQSEYPQDWLALRPTDRKIGDNENDYQCRGDCRQPIDNVSGLKPSIGRL